ncbi:uncharacterized protein LOC143376272 isoform X2 [Andrena cerasifolii]|uniref:uncharacterized protein LOC143376272 isoform X2 n=1 Tax=Andrena cerasifolii TaxID=2819439 RepID=UPI0040380063
MSRHQEELLLLALNLALVVAAAASKSSSSLLAEILHRPIRALTFPEESTAGLFFALAVPLEDPYKSISIANFFEATYDLPTNATAEHPWTDVGEERGRRSLGRATVYQAIENKFIGPTSSRHEQLPQDILQAEAVGRNGGCSEYRPRCPVGLFDLIGVLG